MFRHIYIIIALVTMHFCRLHAQNLVPNPSFENYKNLPCSWNISTDEFREYVSDWYIPGTTSTDIHSSLAEPDCWSNPINPLSTEDCKPGLQTPRTGTTMAGIYTVVNTHTWHEYVQIKLSRPLIPGQRYCVQMWVSAAEYATNTSNNIGMLFSVDPITGNETIFAKPQINQDEAVTDTENWVLISGSFIAEAPMEYLTIGNFFSDEETIQIANPAGSCTDGAYFYIDDVSVMLCPV